MKTRILTAAILLPLVLWALWTEGLLYEILLYGSAAIAAWELTRMTAAWGQPAFRVPAVILSVALPLYSNILYDLTLFYSSESIPSAGMEGLTRIAALLALIGAAALLTAHRVRGVPGRLLATFCVPAVIGGTLFHLTALRSLDRWTFGLGPSPFIDDGLGNLFHSLDRWAPEGLSWIIFLLAVTMATDTAAYFGGVVDAVLMRLADIMIMMPVISVLIVLSALIGVEHFELAVIIGILSGFGGTGVVLKSQALSVVVKPYMDAARAAGGGPFYIIFVHVVPNLLPLSFLYMMFTVTGAVFSEAVLSFLGLLDVRMSWGLMIHTTESAGYLLQVGGYWWLIFPASLSITLLCSSFYLVGRSLDEVVNPRLRRT